MLSRVGWLGQVRVAVIGMTGAVQWEGVNQITNGGLDLMAQALRTVSVNTEITYVALGNGSAAVSASDTELGNEKFRKQVTEQHANGTGVTVTNLYVAPDQANSFDIEEIGWFAGDADQTPGSGIMVARVLYSHSKSNLESLQIERTDTLAAI